MNANLYVNFKFGPENTAPAVTTGDGEAFSYARIGLEVTQTAHRLRAMGLKRGDRVIMQTEKSVYALICYLACLASGLVYVPVNTAYRSRELEFFLNDTGATAVIAGDEQKKGLAPLVERLGVPHLITLNQDGSGGLFEHGDNPDAAFDPVSVAGDDLAAILYTSGTTGQPKGAMLTHSNLLTNVRALHRAWNWQSDDVLLHVLPIFHVHGLFVACHCAWTAGSPMLLLDRPDAQTIVNNLNRVTVMMGVPTHYTRMLQCESLDKTACSHIRVFISGSAPLLAQVSDDFHRRTGHRIVERYGMTETLMNTSNPVDGPRKAGTVGLPLDQVQCRIVDDHGEVCPSETIGNLLIRGPNVFKGYWGKPEVTREEFTADGFFKSGDLALYDDDGYICIAGRGKDLIISGGYNVYPKEVEQCIDELDQVTESAVIGVPHADFGESVVAVVVAAAGGLEEAAVIDHVRNNIAHFKAPKRVYFVEGLPRNAMGKVQKNLLRETYSN